jgi:rhodanese-related sulfurtransferase
VAGLGNFTPAQLPGVQRVTAEQAADLIRQGAVMVDVRSEKEYKARHIAKAVLAPYLEKSPKDVSFDPKQDDFSAAAKLDKAKPTIFACNGAECWKSFKASKAAVALGFQKVYWLRGGLPEWDGKGLPVETSD